MKREFLFYVVLILAVGALIYIQSKFTESQDTGYTRVIDLKPFNKMHIALDYPVYVSQGDDARIAIEGPAGKVDDILLEWRDGELTLGVKSEGFFARFLAFRTVVEDNISIYIRLPKPSIIEAPCTANIITAEDIPGLDSCRHTASELKASEFLMNRDDHPLSWMIRATREFNWEGVFQINFNMN